MKRIPATVLSMIGIVLPVFAFAQVIATDVQCSPPGCVDSVDLKNGSIKNIDISNAAAIDPSKIAGVAWTAANDGAGTGLDADLLDGLDSLQFLRTDQSGILLGTLTARTTTTPQFLIDAGNYGIDYNQEAALWLQSKDAAGAQNWRNGLVTDESGNLILRKSDNTNTDPNIDALVINSSGNVGIGTTTPSEKLAVAGNIQLIGDSNEFKTGNGTITIGSDSGIVSKGKGIIVRDATGANDLAYLGYEGTGYFSGNVGIGTTTPSRSLEIVGDGFLLSGSNDAAGKLQVYKGVMGISAIEMLRIDPADYTTKVYALSVNETLAGNFGNTQNAYITNAGNAYFAGQAKASELCIAGDCRSSWPAAGGGGTVTGTGTAGYLAQWSATSSITTTPVYVIGNTVGIGTTTPGATLDINGTANVQDAFTLGGATTPRLAYPDPDLPDHSNSATAGTIAWYIAQMNPTCAQGVTGGAIYLRPGTYHVNMPIELCSSISIIGMGNNSIIEVGNDIAVRNQGATSEINGTTVKDVLLKDFAVYGDPAVHKTCVLFNADSRNQLVTLDGLYVQNCGAHGIHVKSTDNLTISNTIVTNAGSEAGEHNIYLRQTDQVTISNVQVTLSYDAGFNASEMNTVTISNLIAKDNGTIIDNDKMGRGIKIADAYNITMNSVIALNNVLSGIVFIDDGAFGNYSGVEDVVLNGCVSKGNGNDGLQINTVRELTVTGCDLSSNGRYGINEEGTSTDEVIVGNSLQTNASGAKNGSFAVYSNNN
ncbi:MAG: right-handed parallel beta-helix repeat-containing protein [Candidatus Kerfeldbacteria bacterium]|nr:right-handed parallel beta-helix repeat-containing protein [Candidatus Kerfeldbacteria bacterium]